MITAILVTYFDAALDLKSIQSAANFLFYSSLDLSLPKILIFIAALVSLAFFLLSRPQYKVIYKPERIIKNNRVKRIRRKEILMAAKEFLSMLFMLMAVAPFSLIIFYFARPSDLGFIFIIASVIFGVLYLIVRLYLAIKEILNYRYEKSQLNYHKLVTREYVYEMLIKLSSENLKQHIISYLEENVKEIEGEWPNNNILAAKNKDEISVRLARLEEKWLGLDR